MGVIGGARQLKSHRVHRWHRGAGVGGRGCRAACFDTFAKETESVWRMGAKQSVAYLRLFACICGYFFVIFILRIIITVILTADERGCTQMLWRGDWLVKWQGRRRVPKSECVAGVMDGMNRIDRML